MATPTPLDSRFPGPAPMPPPRGRPGLAGFLAFLAVGALLLSAIAALLGLDPDMHDAARPLALMSSFIHLGLFGWIAATLLGFLALIAARRPWPWLVVLPSLAGLALQASWVAPYYLPDRGPATPALEVAMINVEYGVQAPSALQRAVQGSDVVILLEADTDGVRELAAQDFGRQFPYRVGDGAPSTSAAGTVIFSRFPVDDLGVSPTLFESRLVRVHAASGPLLVAGVHPVHPMGSASQWRQDADALHAWLKPNLSQPLVVAGDFNAIDRHLTMQAWWRSGMRSSADLAGAGLPITWPQGGAWVPFPVIGIDHVLVSPSLTALDHRTFLLPDSDHAGLRTRIGVRR